MMKKITHPFVVEHLQVLEEYFKVQRELFEAVQDVPEDEFEVNSHKVRTMELNEKMDKLSKRLGETVVNLGRIEA